MLQSFHSLMMNKDNWSELIRSMSLGKPFVSAAVANKNSSEIQTSGRVIRFLVKKSAISKVQKHSICNFKNGKKSIFAPEKSLKLSKRHFRTEKKQDFW